MTNVFFILAISLSMYFFRDKVEVIVKITGAFVGSFEICILPVLMFFVLNKRYGIVGNAAMISIIIVTCLVSITLFISLG